MNTSLNDLINRGLSKDNKLALIKYVRGSRDRFNELMLCFKTADYRQAQLIAWAVSEIIYTHPDFIRTHHQDLLRLMTDDEVHVGIRRNIVRLYQFAPIPEHIEGQLYDHCLQFIQDPQEAIAVRAFSMTVCYRIVERYPDLANELRVSIEESLEDASSGLQNRASKILKKLMH